MIRGGQGRPPVTVHDVCVWVLAMFALAVLSSVGVFACAVASQWTEGVVR